MNSVPFSLFFLSQQKNFVALAKKKKNQISVFDYIIDLQNNSKKKKEMKMSGIMTHSEEKSTLHKCNTLCF